MKNFIEFNRFFFTDELQNERRELIEPFFKGQYDIGQTEKGELVLIHTEHEIKDTPDAIWCVISDACSNGSTKKRLTFENESGDSVTTELPDGVWAILGQKDGRDKYWAFKVSLARNYAD